MFKTLFFILELKSQLLLVDKEISQVDRAIEKLSSKKQKLLSKKQEIKQRLQESASEKIANQDWERSGNFLKENIFNSLIRNKSVIKIN